MREQNVEQNPDVIKILNYLLLEHKVDAAVKMRTTWRANDINVSV